MIPEVYYKFIRRWFLVLLAGLVAGAGLGYVYRGLSPIEARAMVGPVSWEWPLKLGAAPESGFSFQLVGVTQPRPPLYRASAALYIRGSLPSWSYGDAKQSSTAAQQMAALAARTRGQAFLEAVSAALPGSVEYTPQELSSIVQVMPSQAAAMLQISAIGPNKEEMALIAQTVAQVLVDRIMAEEEQLARDRKKNLEAQLQDIKRQQDAVQEERLGLTKEPVQAMQANLTTYGEAQLAEMLEVTTQVKDSITPLSAERMDTERRLRQALDRLEALERDQTQALNSKIDQQLALLAGISDSDEYVKLDGRISYLRGQLRAVATNIASVQTEALRQEAANAAVTQARIASLNAQLESVKDRLALATGQREQMVAQARDSIQVNLESLAKAQQAEMAETNGLLQEVLAQLQTQQAAQSKDLSSEINKQLTLLAGTADSDDYIKLDSKISYLRGQLRSVATNIASLELETLGQNADDAVKTWTKIDAFNAQFKLIRDQLDYAKAQRDRMVAQARDSIQVNLQSFAQAQQAEMTDTKRVLQEALDRLQTLHGAQSQDLSSALNKQLDLLAGLAGSQEFLRLDDEIASLQAELRTLATNIASLEMRALDAATTQARLDSLDAQFRTLKAQLDLAQEERNQMVAQARDTIRLDLQPFLEAQQPEIAQGLESARELLGPLPAARTDAEARLVVALASLQALEMTQRAAIEKTIAQETSRLASVREEESYLIVLAKAGALQKQFATITSSIAAQELLDLTAPQKYISASSPAEPESYTPPPPMRKRDSLVFGGGAGLAVAWLAAGFIDFRRNNRHQPTAPRGPGRVRSRLAGLRRRRTDSPPAVLGASATGQESPQQGNP